MAGEMEGELQKNGSKITSTLMVVGARTNLLGRPEIACLHLVNVINWINLEDKYENMYQGLRKLPEIFKIQMKNNSIPVCLQIPKKWDYAKQQRNN